MGRWNPVLFMGGECQLDPCNEQWDQITIFWIDQEPPDPDDYASKSDWLTAWQLWEHHYPELAAAI